MYAVFEDGSRQYVVSEGDVVKLDYRQVEEGSPLELNRVLLYVREGEVQIGQPVVEGARVLAEVIDHPSTKTYIQKFRRRKNYRRLRGHRQHYTTVEIMHILLAGQEPPPPQEEDQEQGHTQEEAGESNEEGAEESQEEGAEETP
jgi:large subunit ribosomal protein L21